MDQKMGAIIRQRVLDVAMVNGDEWVSTRALPFTFGAVHGPSCISNLSGGVSSSFNHLSDPLAKIRANPTDTQTYLAAVRTFLVRQFVRSSNRLCSYLRIVLPHGSIGESIHGGNCVAGGNLAASSDVSVCKNRTRLMGTSERVALITLAGILITAILTAAVGIYQVIVKRKENEGAADATKYDVLVKSLETMRQEYRTDATRLSAELHTTQIQHREELNAITRRQAELEGHIIKQSKYFEGVMLKLESFMSLKDAELIVSHIQRLVSEMREFMENSPIGLPEIARNRLLEAERKHSHE